jgi:hypothetical protein
VFSVLTAVSLLLCVAVCVLWVRSYVRTESVTRYGAGGWLVSFESDRGRFVVWVQRWGRTTPRWELESLPPVAWGTKVSHTRGRRLLGFAAGADPEPFWFVVVPMWSVLVLAAVLPAIRFRDLAVGRARRRPGHCRNCGYDLRASPERCPECGTTTADAGTQ